MQVPSIMRLSPPTHWRRPAAVLVTVLVALGVSGAGRSQDQTQPPLREQFRKMVLADRKIVDLNPVSVAKSTLNNVITERVRFTSEEGQDAIALIFRPKEEARYPVVVAQHFLGGSKDHLAFAILLSGLANRGFMAVAIDGRFRGERQNGKSLGAAMADALKTGKGKPWLIDTVYDVTRLLDYLQTRPDVDASRIGMTGISEGGVITWMTAVMDDRIKVAAPVIGVTSFNDSLSLVDDAAASDRLSLLKDLKPALKDFAAEIGEPEVNTKVLKAAWERLYPGAMDRFDGPSLIPTIAPRPLLVLNHEKDELFSLAGANRVAEVARTRYKELNVADRFEFKVQPGLKHSDVSALFAELNVMGAFMEKWLKNPALAAGG